MKTLFYNIQDFEKPYFQNLFHSSHDFFTQEFKDELLKRLLFFPNVFLTPPIGFSTKEALTHIASATALVLKDWKENQVAPHELRE